MSRINVSNLTFCYEGSYDNIFEKVSFAIDTDWKLGFIGRNGKGKSTFLQLLLGKYPYEGSISASVAFDYFPYTITAQQEKQMVLDVIEAHQPDYELWRICRELDLLKGDAEMLYRPWETLSHGERTKVMLAMLFSREHYFLLIDEPTNHLDGASRELVRDYLNSKKGFILVSHDRWLLDACVDHVLVLNRSNIQVEKGNFSSWWENKTRQDHFEQAENEKLKREIGKLQEASRRTAAWVEKVERSKIGFDPVKEHDRFLDTRAYIGEKSRRMEQRKKNLMRRQEEAISEKEKLLKNVETPVELKIMPLTSPKQVLVRAREVSLFYDDVERVRDFNMELRVGECVVLAGKNGCGKSSIIKAILDMPQVTVLNGNVGSRCENRRITGTLDVASNLVISYINQDTSYLRGSLDDYIEQVTGSYDPASISLFRSILRQLDFERVQFEKPMEEYSEGQKKKVLLAGSLMSPAHLYIWDEPLNYIDVFSRMQIESLLKRYRPTLLLVEHDKTFAEAVATQTIRL